MVSFLVGMFTILQEISIFLLVFAVLYSVLKNTTLITRNQNINIMIAFSISMFFQILRYYLEITFKFIQIIGLAFVFTFLIFMLSGWVGFDFNKYKRGVVIFSIATVLILFLYVININAIDWLWNNFKELIYMAIIFYLLGKFILGGFSDDGNLQKTKSNTEKKENQKETNIFKKPEGVKVERFVDREKNDEFEA